MNAAARALAQGLVIISSQTNARKITLSKTTISLLALIFATVLSALTVVTLTDINRRAFSDLASLQQTRDDLRITWGQLLLEENTWAAPARVEAIAQQNFAMNLPAPQNIIVLKPE